MPTRRLVVFAVSWCVVTTAWAETLTFVAQFDEVIGATNYSWFSPNNWWVEIEGRFEPSGRVPQANETAIVTGSVDGGMSGVRVQTLVLTNGATVMNGTFAVEQLELLSDSAFSDARINVLTSLRVGGTNCTLEASTLTVLGQGSGLFSPIAPAPAATLNLDRGSVLWNANLVRLEGGTQIRALGPPQNRLMIANACILRSSGAVVIRGSDSNPLVIDNSGLILADTGTLAFEEGIDWQSTMNAGEFRAGDSNAQLLFGSPMQVPATVTDLFTGPGTNRFLAGAIIDGLAQVGWVNTNAQMVTGGNLEVDESISGAGRLHVIGGTSQAGVLTWNNGTFSLPEISIEHGARLWFSGGLGAARQLSGCALNNSGTCAVLSPGLSLTQGSSILNLAEGTFDVSADGVFSGGPMPEGGEFINEGLFRKSSPGITTFGTSALAQGPDFSNGGVVDVLAGSLNLLSGASSGRFHTAAGATLWFWGGAHILNSGAAFTGDGLVKLMQGASPPKWLVDGSVTVVALELGSNGTLVGSGKTSPGMVHLNSLVTSDNGMLTNANVGVAQMRISGQFLAANSSITVSNGLTVQGTNCLLMGAALDLLPGARASLAPAVPGQTARLRLIGSVLQNSGEFQLQDGSTLDSEGAPQSQLIVLPGGLVSCTNSGVIRGSASDHLLVESTGAFRADSGTLTFDGAIDWQSREGWTRFDAAAQASLLLFAGSAQFPAGMTCAFTGPGTNRLTAGTIANGILQVGMIDPGTQNLRPGNLELDGELGGSGALRILSSGSGTGGCAWNSGRLRIAALHIDPGGKLIITGDSLNSRELSGCIVNNSGLVLWPGQQLSAGAGAVFNVLPGGTIDINGDARLAFNNHPPRLVLNNSGTVLKSAGLGNSILSIDFTNSATLEVRTGTLSLDGVAVQRAGTSLIGEGAVFGAPAFLVEGGTVSGSGRLDANVANSGIFSPGAPLGVLSLSPLMDYQQAPTGALRIELGGTNAGSLHDHLAAGRNAQLAGQLILEPVNGFVPQPGQFFQVLSCASLSGAFDRIAAPALPNLVWVPRYSVTNAMICLAHALTLAPPSLAGGVLSLSFSTTPGLVYVVQACDELTAPQWETVATLTGDGLTKTLTPPATAPARFFRVLIQ